MSERLLDIFYSAEKQAKKTTPRRSLFKERQVDWEKITGGLRVKITDINLLGNKRVLRTPIVNEEEKLLSSTIYSVNYIGSRKIISICGSSAQPERTNLEVDLLSRDRKNNVNASYDAFGRLKEIKVSVDFRKNNNDLVFFIDNNGEMRFEATNNMDPDSVYSNNFLAQTKEKVDFNGKNILAVRKNGRVNLYIIENNKKQRLASIKEELDDFSKIVEIAFSIKKQAVKMNKLLRLIGIK